MQDVKLLISVPSCRDWKPQFGASMCGLVQHIFSEGLSGRLKTVELSTKFQASCLSEAREEALTYALANDFTHWFSVDDDMMFPEDVIDRLLVHDKDVMTANYRRKQEKVVPICLDLEGQFLDSTGKTGIEEIGFMGGGCNLIRLEAIKDIEAPRFSVLYVKEKNAYMGEDYFFSVKLREKGVKLFVDHDVSQEIKHVGDVVYTFPRG